MKRNTNLFLGLATAVCLVLGFYSFSVSAQETPVAKIGDTEYTTIQEAVDAAQNRQTITLLTDCSQEIFAVPDEKVVVFDRTDAHYSLGKVGENIDATMKVYDVGEGNKKVDLEKTEIYGGFDAVLDFITEVPRSNTSLELYKDVTMTKDQTLPNNVGHSTNSTLVILRDITLDLNGHHLSQAKGSGWNNYATLQVNNRANTNPVILTLKDSSPDQSGVLDSIKTAAYVHSGSAGGTIIQNGGTITAQAEQSDYDKTNQPYRMPVSLEGVGSFIMNGGKIETNSAETSNYQFIYILAEEGKAAPKFTVTGGVLNDDGSVTVPEKLINTSIYPLNGGQFIVEPASGLKMTGNYYGTSGISIKSGLYVNPPVLSDDNAEYNFVAEGYAQDDSNKDCYLVDDETSAAYPYIVLPTYTVSFDVNHSDAKAIDSQTLIWGNTAVKPEDPVVSNAVFSAWQDADGQTFDFATAVKRDYPLIAAYEPKKVTIEFQWTNAPTNLMLPNKIVGNISEEINIYESFKKGEIYKTENGSYEFAGWFYDEELSKPADEKINPDSNMILYGKWQTVQSTPDPKPTPDSKPSSASKPSSDTESAADTKPAAEQTPIAVVSANPQTPQTAKAPGTGDSTNLTVWWTILLTSGAAAIMITLGKKKLINK